MAYICAKRGLSRLFQLGSILHNLNKAFVLHAASDGYFPAAAAVPTVHPLSEANVATRKSAPLAGLGEVTYNAGSSNLGDDPWLKRFCSSLTARPARWAKDPKTARR